MAKMTIDEMKELALCAVRGKAPANYTIDSVDKALADGFKELASSINQFQKNKYDIFEIIIQAVEDQLPKKTLDVVGSFAEVKQVGQGQKALFKKKVGKNRAKKFLTQVGLSGVYETFRLDNSTFEVGAHAIGGAGRIDFERMLDGADVMSDIMDIIVEGLTDAAFLEIQKALKAALTSMPATNVFSGATFQADKMQKLINVVKAYGENVVIFATPEFITAMGPDAIVPPISGAAQGIYSPDDIESIHNTGKVKIFRGTPIVEIPQSFIDEKNTKTWIDPQMAYILPTGGEKVVKLVFEGQTQMYDWTNPDQSMEINAYKKMGCAILSYHNWAIYQNTGITQTYESPYGFDD